MSARWDGVVRCPACHGGEAGCEVCGGSGLVSQRAAVSWLVGRAHAWADAPQRPPTRDELVSAFALGFDEGDGMLGVTWGDDRDEAYDMGRTLRRWRDGLERRPSEQEAPA